MDIEEVVAEPQEEETIEEGDVKEVKPAKNVVSCIAGVISERNAR